MDLTQIEETISQLYAININFFREYYPGIFDKIEKFENFGIENYHLDIDNGHFEIVSKNGDKLYNCNPYNHSKYKVETIHTHNNYISLLELQNHKPYTEDYEIEAFKYTNQLIDITKTTNISKYTQIKKFIFIGTMLGIHIEDIIKQTKAKQYLIVEPDIEIFRLSLMMIDYRSLITNNNILFLVGFSDDEFTTTLQSFLDVDYQYNHLIKFDIANKNMIKLFENITEFFMLHHPYKYPFSEYLGAFKKHLEYLNQKFSILDLRDSIKILDKYHTIFLGAGPSLKNNIDLVKKIEDNVVIVAMGAVLPRLALEGIIPDIIITIDIQYKPVAKQFDVDKKFYENSIIIASSKTDPSIIKKFDKTKLFLIQTSLAIQSDKGTFTGASVGDIGYQVLLKFKPKELYLLGIDASLSEDGFSHDTTHYSSKKYDLQDTSIFDNDGISDEKQTIKVKGNFKDEVYTNYIFKPIIETFKKVNNTKIKVYNLSDGAYLKGTIPMYPHKLTIQSNKIDKNSLKSKILSKLKQYSSSSLNNLDKKLLLQNKQVVKELLNSSSKYDSFKIVFKKHPYLLSLQILDQYYRLVLPYCDYLENFIDKKDIYKLVNKHEEEILNSLS